MRKLRLLLKITTVLILLLLLQHEHEIIVAAVAYYNHSTVESLPGLNGPLPFHLETGYIGVGKDDEVQMFYYFLPSKSDPANDPLLVWLTGGPGCSSIIALVYEIGPLRFAEQVYNGSVPTLVINPHDWTQIASVIFLDQPANAGFSYATDSAAYKYTDLRACEYINEFLRKWLRDRPEFISNPFYVAGNSYSGITVPIVTQMISDANEAGNKPIINLQGYLLGNPLAFPEEPNYHIPFSHGMGLISNELYESLKENCKGEYRNLDPSNRACANDLETFEQMVGNINKEHILRPNCGSDAELRGPHKLAGERRLLEDCDDEELISLPGGSKCATDWRRLVKHWANEPSVQEALHVRKGIIRDWARCRKSIKLHNYTMTTNNVVPYHANLSIKGYRSIIYSGDHDFMIPFQSTQAWIKSLNYSIVDDWRPWNLDGQIAGYTRSFSNKMTYATVKGSGHTAGSYKPEQCFAMFKRWINYEPL